MSEPLPGELVLARVRGFGRYSRHVFGCTRPRARLGDKIADFVAASQKNASASLREPGVVRFDLVQSMDDPTRFVLS